MKLYNTLTHTIDDFIPNEEGKVKLYTCGPTVYHYAHIGNLRSYIMEDVLQKGLEFLGYEVERVMNITDVGHLSSDADTGEDKMVKGAKRENKTVMEIAKFYTDAFFDDFTKLNNKMPSIIEPATNLIPEYIKMIEGLLEKGYAYEAGGNIYFDTSKLSNYYVFGQQEEGIGIAVRDNVEEDSNKRNKTDFVLWFTKSKFEDQELKWESPWGVGYPGWHIECSCISLKHLGEHLDIHCGGIDNSFPHHTNEIAQTESFIGHKWCNYWFHVEFLNDSSGKMSKSKGDILILPTLIDKGYNPLVYRLFCLQSHYRNPLAFSYESLDIAVNVYNKLKGKIKVLLIETGDEELEQTEINKYLNQFKDAIANDLNTSLMLTALYDVLKSDLNNISKKHLIREFDKVLSLDLLKEEKKEISGDLENYISEMIEQRNAAKLNKNYALADKIRDDLKEKGIVIKDSKEGTIFEIE